MSRSKKSCGFTMIEILTVLVMLGILSAVGSDFVVRMIDGYRQTELLAELTGRGRLTLEQMARYLRQAVPNSLRLSADNRCVEFLPLYGGANYLSPLADAENGAAAVTSIVTSPFVTGTGAAAHAVVAPLTPAELYTIASPSSRASVANATSTAVTLSSAHVFNRNSNLKRIFLADDPKRFCLVGTDLMLVEGYGLDTGALSTLSPGGTSSPLATGISSAGSAFELSPGSEDRNAVLQVSLTFTERGTSVALSQRIFVRNVP
jgi:MSHA biogenesis protein MshO